MFWYLINTWLFFPRTSQPVSSAHRAYKPVSGTYREKPRKGGRQWFPRSPETPRHIWFPIINLKGRVSRDFRPFLSWFEPFWAPKKQVKILSISCSISPRYSNLQETPRCEWHRDVISTAKPEFSFFLGEIETEFENVFACLSGGIDVFESWKNRGPKSREKLPFSLKTWQLLE